MFVIQILDKVLTQLIAANMTSARCISQPFLSKFQSSYAPGITIISYLERINKYAKCSPNCFIAALIYIDRLVELKNVVLTELNIHRLIITSILLSTKFYDDEFYKNSFYGKLGGISTEEMNSLESEFLQLIGFRLYISQDVFEKYQRELQSFGASGVPPQLTPPRESVSMMHSPHPGYSPNSHSTVQFSPQVFGAYNYTSASVDSLSPMKPPLMKDVMGRNPSSDSLFFQVHSSQQQKPAAAPEQQQQPYLAQSKSNESYFSNVFASDLKKPPLTQAYSTSQHWNSAPQQQSQPLKENYQPNQNSGCWVNSRGPSNGAMVMGMGLANEVNCTSVPTPAHYIVPAGSAPYCCIPNQNVPLPICPPNYAPYMVQWGAYGGGNYVAPQHQQQQQVYPQYLVEQHHHQQEQYLQQQPAGDYYYATNSRYVSPSHQQKGMRRSNSGNYKHQQQQSHHQNHHIPTAPAPCTIPQQPACDAMFNCFPNHPDGAVNSIASSAWYC